jgi:glycosyltransferase involved in cell wall biosynthesis
MPARKLRITHVNTFDIAGGAERIARSLSAAERAAGHASWLVVGTKHTDDPTTVQIPALREMPPGPGTRLVRRLYARLAPFSGRVRGVGRVRRALLAAQDWPEVERRRGYEVFHYPGSRRLLTLTPHAPDVVHAHNLHTDYFDLRYLPTLSRRVPLVLTLHDQWMMTGHCGFSFGCERWRSGCGRCPDLRIYPPLQADGTDDNWRRKRAIYARCRLHVATPSDWLRRLVEASILAPGLREVRVIPYGIDTATFRPADRASARAQLGLPAGARVILFSANYVRNNPRKDLPTLEAAVAALAERRPDLPLLLLALGERRADRSVERMGAATVWIEPYTLQPAAVARYYQAADVYAHPSRADNLPLTVMEACACGTPVVAANVGGVPELVRDDETGFLVPPADPAALSARLECLLDDESRRARLGAIAAERMRRGYDLAQMAAAYLDWYAALAG